MLDNFASTKKSYVTAQYIAERRRFERIYSPQSHEATVNELALNEFEECWADSNSRLKVIPGKDAISALNQHLQDTYGVSITPTAIIDAMNVNEVPTEMRELIEDISRFREPELRGLISRFKVLAAHVGERIAATINSGVEEGRSRLVHAMTIPGHLSSRPSSH